MSEGKGGVVDKGLVQFLVRGAGRISLEREGMRGSVVGVGGRGGGGLPPCQGGEHPFLGTKGGRREGV